MLEAFKDIVPDISKILYLLVCRFLGFRHVVFPFVPLLIDSTFYLVGLARGTVFSWGAAGLGFSS